MSEVLVVVDHADSEVKKPTFELLTIAKRLGEPVAVFFGSPDQGDAVAEKVKKYGAAKVGGAEEHHGRLAEAARDREELVGRLLDLAVGVVDDYQDFRHGGSPVLLR